jgi:ABC-type uncharacterized transport system auxiliary subunit
MSRVLLLAGLALGACSLTRPTPEMHYYTLSVAGVPAAPPPAPLRVGLFTVEDAYATPRLAYRSSPYRIDYYVYHRWAGSPGRIVASAARDYLDAVAPVRDGPPLEVSGHVRRLEEVDTPQGWQVALALDLRVERAGEVILAAAYAEEEPAATESAEAVAAALSRALGRILDRFVGELAAPPDSDPR